MNNADPTVKLIKRRWIQVLAKDKQFLPLIRHPLYYSWSQDMFDTTIYANKHKYHNLLQTNRGKDEPNIVFMRKS